MRSVLALVSLVFAATSLAAPALEERQASCVRTLPGRFRVSATFDRNATIPLGLTDVPSAPPGNVAVLAIGPPGNVLFSLQDGRIPAFNPNPRGISVGARAGTPVTFFRSPPTPTGPLEPYCALGQPDGEYLGVSGDIRAFAICGATGSNVAEIVYRPSPANGGTYDINTCRTAFVKIQQLQ